MGPLQDFQLRIGLTQQFEQSEAKRNKPIKQFGTGNGLRRREGEKAKRFSV